MSESYDWNAIRADYESGQFSQSALERKYGVSRRAISKRASKEHWVTSTGPRSQVPGNPQGVINHPVRDVNLAVRTLYAIELRQKGWTYERIASQCGYASPGAARNAVQNELNRMIAQKVEDWRNDQISRLEKMHEELWDIVTDKEARGRLFAYDRLIAISERQAKLLGLDMDRESPPAQIVVRETPTGYLAPPEMQS